MSILLFLLTLALAFSFQREVINKRALELVSQMADLKAFPPYLERGKLVSWILEDSYPKGRLYINYVPLNENLLAGLITNTNVEGIPERIEVRYGITLKQTDLKLLPTDKVVHRGDPNIDYNQYTTLDPSVPLLVLWHSKDKNWFFVQSSFMRGWIKVKDVRLISREEFFRILNLPFLVVLKPELKIKDLSYSMGAKVPYMVKESGKYLVLMPDGGFQWIKGEGLSENHLDFSQEKAKVILDSLLGYSYRWGGYYDCSALVRAFFSVFGLELPRNSYQQVLLGEGAETKFGSYEELKETLKSFPPYRTVIYMKGHIMIFGGFEGDDVVVYHSAYAIKKDTGEKVYPRSVVKNLLERDGLKNLHSRVVAIKVLK